MFLLLLPATAPAADDDYDNDDDDETVLKPIKSRYRYTKATLAQIIAQKISEIFFAPFFSSQIIAEIL